MKRLHLLLSIGIGTAFLLAAAIAAALWMGGRIPVGEGFAAFADSARARLGLPARRTLPDTAVQADTAGREGIAPDTARDDRDVPEYRNRLTAQAPARKAGRGIIIVGTGQDVRAMMVYGGGPNSGVPYATAANKYKATLGDGVAVYCMVIPTAAAFYCPESMQGYSHAQHPTIRNVHAHLDPDVRAVDVYTPLGQHAAEHIYLRTDHHWTPLGAYYAAERFAEVAGVPYPPLEEYEADTIRRIVGSMYTFTKAAELRAAPEDFIYYLPRNVEYQATFIDYTVDKDGRVTGETAPHAGRFFARYKDGSAGAYCTLMGGDIKTVKVHTSTPGSRRLIIIKDSFGNALPAHLFHSFEEVHVVDFRYFTKNMVRYVRENGITDVLFACNIFNVCSPSFDKKCERLLTQ